MVTGVSYGLAQFIASSVLGVDFALGAAAAVAGGTVGGFFTFLITREKRDQWRGPTPGIPNIPH
jgi:predicted membrane protein